MPHVVVKMLPGRTEEQETQLASAIVRDVVAIAGCGEESVSVAIEEVPLADWTEKVYQPEIATAAARGTLYRPPGYEP
jgi:4-oxalocrotonate tautomerase